LVDISGETLEIPIEGKKVLVKFYFTNMKLIPQGLRLVKRHEEAIETKRLMEGKKLGLPNYGYETIRPGRVDTGAQQYRKFQNVDFASTWEQLRKQYTTIDAHCFLQEQSTGMKKPVVIVNFAKSKDFPGQIPPKASLIAAIEQNLVHGSTWGVVHHYTNPNGVITINCLQRQPKSP